MKSILRKWLPLSLFVGLAFCFQNCSSSNSESTDPPGFNFSTAEVYFRSTENIHTHVFYEPGAEPYTGNNGSGFVYWSVLEDNLNSIFQYRTSPPQLNIPSELSEMTSLESQSKSSWTSQDILNLHYAQNNTESTSTDSRFYIYFLKGYFNDGSSNKTTTIGVQIGKTSVIAIFKEVIQNSGLLPNGPVAKFVEQSTLVHEMGHALGFVNNGVPMKASHQDSEHGAHTTNEDCVMFWLNEGVDGASDFVQDYVSSGNTIMWGPEVLSDAENFSQ